jgi:hypothetical protein
VAVAAFGRRYRTRSFAVNRLERQTSGKLFDLIEKPTQRKLFRKTKHRPIPNSFTSLAQTVPSILDPFQASAGNDTIKYKMPSAFPDPKTRVENEKERQFREQCANRQQILIEAARAPIVGHDL